MVTAALTRMLAVMTMQITRVGAGGGAVAGGSSVGCGAARAVGGAMCCDVVSPVDFDNARRVWQNGLIA